VRRALLPASVALSPDLVDPVAQPDRRGDCKWLFSMTIQAGVDTRTVNPNDFQSVTVDSTVQVKAVTYSTDGKLYPLYRAFGRSRH